ESKQAEETAAKGAEAEAAAAAKGNKNTLPIRAYLDQTVVPILLNGLSQLVKERPDGDPVECILESFGGSLANRGSKAACAAEPVGDPAAAARSCQPGASLSTPILSSALQAGTPRTRRLRPLAAIRRPRTRPRAARPTSA
ncbi:Protein dpy-30 homolog (Dpy-30-like protein) (Dpy-30L), partial [Durusdinium trenchii]